MARFLYSICSKPRREHGGYRCGGIFFSANPKTPTKLTDEEIPERVLEELKKGDVHSMLILVSKDRISDRAPKCIGTKKDGSPCKKDAEDGFKTCIKHRDQEPK